MKTLTRKKLLQEIEVIKSTMTDVDLFGSIEFADYLKSALKTATQGVPREITLSVNCNPQSNETACTSGEKVYINTLGPLIRPFETRYGKYAGNIGHIVHETGHILFTDFVATGLAMNNLLGNAWFPCKPQNENADKVMELFKQCPPSKLFVQKLYMQLANIFEDPYIENRLRTEVFSGLFANSLAMVNEKNYDHSPSIEQQVYKMLSGQGVSRTSIFTYILFMRSLGFYRYDIKHDDTFFERQVESKEDAEALRSIQERLMQSFEELYEECLPYIEILKTEQVGEERYKALSEILCIMYPLVEADLKGMQSQQPQSQNSKKGQGNNSNSSNGSQGSSSQSDGNSSSDSNGQQQHSDSDSQNSPDNNSYSENNQGGQSGEDGKGNNADSGNNSGKEEKNEPQGNSFLSPDEIKDMIDTLVNQLKNSGITEASGNTRPVNSSDLKNCLPNTTPSQGGRPDVDDSVKEQIEEMLEKMMKDKATAEAEEKLQQEQKRQQQQIANKEKPNDNVRYYFASVAKNKEVYDYSYNQIRSLITPSVKRMEKVLKERQKEGNVSGYRTGKFDVKSSYRIDRSNDARIFKRRYEKDGNPDVCFALRIDQSGSMMGDKAESAQQTAILLDAMLRACNVDYMIYGDSIQDQIDLIYVYKNFDEVMSDGKYMLGDVHADCGRNMDGASIDFGCRELLKQKAKKKVLISITDGAPTGGGFYSSYPLEDAILTVKHYRKKGVEIFGAVIDGDLENIQKIYGTQTIDLTDLSSLSKTLARLVERYVVNS